jgi:hypothetical protein
MESAALRAAQRASGGRRLVALLLAGGIAASVQPARGSGAEGVCLPFGIGWLAITSFANLGFSVHAGLSSRRHPGYPGFEGAEAALGVMAPQALISAAGLAAGIPTRCFGSPAQALLYTGVPLLWSTALLAYNAWALYQVGRDPNNFYYRPDMGPGQLGAPLSIGASRTQVSLVPGLVAPQAFGVRLSGVY